MKGSTLLMSWMNLLLFDPSVQGQVEVPFEMKAALIDRCTGKPTVLTNPNGTSIRVEFPQIARSEPVTLELEWRLAGIPGDFSERNRILRRAEIPGDEVRAHQAYFYSLPSAREFETIEKRANGSHVWNLTLLATQGYRIQGASASILRVGPQFDYYSIKGSPLCRWSTSLRVSSPYRYHPGPDPLILTRRVSLYSESGFGKDFFPPVFKGRGHEALFAERYDFDREWKLSPRQGGFFADHEIVTRLQAEHFEWKDPPEGCGSFVRTQSGTIDLPESSSEFYTVPQGLLGDEAALHQFLETLSPPIQTCESTPNPRVDLSSTEFEFIPDHP